MLSPNDDRLDYGQILAPPEGLRLDFAVGTTYSLDLDALIGACLPLGLALETDSALKNNPICVLQALRALGDKLAIFCQAGQIHLPNRITRFYVLLEKIVFQVNVESRRGIAGYPSFHPKFWLLRFLDKNENVFYRIAVLSRNLSFDRSWDVSFYMDGKKSTKSHRKNRPVSDFLNYLANKMDDPECEKARAIKNMANELSTIAFESREFHDFTFIPGGIGKGAARHTILDKPLFENYGKDGKAEGLDELMIISPFLSKGVIRYFNDRCRKGGKNALISRLASLAGLEAKDCDSFRIYTLKDAVIDGSEAISEEGLAARQDIHAKLYFTRKNSEANLYVGSLNATHNALYGNVEFMICLHSDNRNLNLEKLCKSLFGEDDAANPFQSLSMDDLLPETDQENTQLQDTLIKETTRANPTAEIVEDGDFYTAIVRFDVLPDYPDAVSLTLAPLLVRKSLPISREMRFTSLALTDLSEFYILKLNDGINTVERVIRIITSGMPEMRDKAIVSSVIGDRASFYRYVAWLLGDSFILSVLETEQIEEQAFMGNSSGKSRKQRHFPALYEKMLRAAFAAPEKFREIDYLLNVLAGDGAIPEGFEKLYLQFKKVVES